MNNIALGRYVPYNTFIHRMDARAKLLALIAMMVAVFLPMPDYVMTFIIGGALAAIILGLLLISRVSLIDVFKSLRVLWFFVLLLMIINVLIPPTVEGTKAFNIGDFVVYWESIFQSLKIILRLVLMIELTMILTATTKPLELTYALEWYLTPLKVVKFPVHEVAMTISIALRFIPTLLDETDRIMKAQSSRGVDFKHGKIGARIKAIVSLIIPLFISSFQRSEELADSMEARGYDPKAKRTKYRILHFSFVDLLSMIFCLVTLGGVIVVSELEFTLATPSFVIWYITALTGLLIYCLVIALVNTLRGKKA